MPSFNHTRLPFGRQVYQLLLQVPQGRVTTYKALAQAMGNQAYQAVGNALKNNPDAPRIPCHRVVKSNGQLGGFNGHTQGKEIQRKMRLLESEGVSVSRGKIVNFNQVFFQPIAN